MKKEVLNRCPICGSKKIRERVSTRRVRVAGHEYVIPNDSAMHCGTCGESYYTPLQARNSTRKLNALKAERQGQLTPIQIEVLRKRIGLSQKEVEARLSLGPKTMTRWESGDKLPRQSTDRLLRVFFHFPSFVLRDRVQSPFGPEPQILGQTGTISTSIAINAAMGMPEWLKAFAHHSERTGPTEFEVEEVSNGS